MGDARTSTTVRMYIKGASVGVMYLVTSRDQNAGPSHSTKIDNSSIERVEQFKYLGTTLTDQNSIQEEIKSRLRVRECLLSFCAASSVFQVAIQKSKD